MKDDVCAVVADGQHAPEEEQQLEDGVEGELPDEQVHHPLHQAQHGQNHPVSKQVCSVEGELPE